MATLIFAGVIIPTTTEDDDCIFNVEVSVFVYESFREIIGTIKERMTKRARTHIAQRYGLDLALIIAY